MFAGLDPLKLSSESQNAHVFHFKMATAGQMLKKTIHCKPIQALSNSNTVSLVFLLTGSYNVDIICENDHEAFYQACREITELVVYIKEIFRHAIVHLVNILPRECKRRMDVIKRLNDFIFSISNRTASGTTVYFDTYYNRMFTYREGQRKAELFMKNGNSDSDNMHLNIKGIRKLGAQLKFKVHNCNT